MDYRILFSQRSAIVTCILAALLVLSPAHAADLSEIKEPLFNEANEALTAANEARASLLAPRTYQAAGEDYQAAEKTFRDGGNIESIQESLKDATAGFRKSVKAAAVARTLFESTLQARADAENAEADTYAADTWRKAEVQFFEAASALERNRKRSAERDSEDASELYRAAELEAIKANYLNETLALLDTAEDLRAERYAPKSYRNAKELLGIANQELTENRYDTDRPRNIAQRAKHEANHAIYVARLVDAQRDDDLTLEDILLEWEGHIGTLADDLDVPIFFDNGPKEPVAQIQAAIDRLQQQLTDQALALEERDAQLVALNTQVTELQRRLGGEAEAVESLNQILAQQERDRQRFTQVEQLFPLEEATVLRRGNTVIIRMIGLTFDSGSASLKNEHMKVLAKLDQAIQIFPGSSVVVEGHTDAFGSDATNLELSQRRAESVEAYLTDSAGYDKDRITALGYGESQPVANNETSEGRQRNRRIDVVIYPGD